MNLEDLAERVARLEAEVGVIRLEAAAARALATGANRDVADYGAELRGHTRVLGALRETQLEQGEAITQLREDVGQLTGAFGQLTGTVGQLTEAVVQIRDQHGARLNDIVGLLNQLIDRDGDQD